MEFYFSDSNLPQDRYLKERVTEDPEASDFVKHTKTDPFEVIIDSIDAGKSRVGCSQ